MHLTVVGGSDAGISAALRARELDPTVDVTVVVADAFPNYSICGIPYFISGEVGHWSNLAHRTLADLEATGMRLMLDSTATAITPAEHTLTVCNQAGREHSLTYDALMVGTSSAAYLAAVPLASAVPDQPIPATWVTVKADEGLIRTHCGTLLLTARSAPHARRANLPLTRASMVGDTGFEPVTSSV